MEFTRLTAECGDFAPASGELCTKLRPGVWLIEADHSPPPAHRPERLLSGRSCEAATAISLSTATLLNSDLGQTITKWLHAMGCVVEPLSGLAVHELLLNAAIHGNLEIASGSCSSWDELSARHDLTVAARRAKARSTRVLTMAVGWNARMVAVVIADQGAGYEHVTSELAAGNIRRGAGRGLKIARRVGCVEVLDGGRCAALLLERAPAMDLPELSRGVPDTSAHIVVLDQDAQEAQRISDWLRSAGLGPILTARTCEEAIFMLGRQPISLLIIDEEVPVQSEQRLLRHITLQYTRTAPPFIRLMCEHSRNPLGLGRAMAFEVVQKPLQLHEIVVCVGSVLQRKDLLGHLDRNPMQSVDHLETARRMQLGLLPTAEQLKMLEAECGVGLAGLCRSGEAVGGDFWAAYPTGRGRVALAVVDFAGHGLGAALNTFRLHAILSEQNLPRGAPRRMTALLNHRLHALLPRGHYATMIYGQIDPASHRIAWSSAAGPPPIFVSASGVVMDLPGRGLPLGVKANASFQSYNARLPGPGILCVFSDGLYESGPCTPEISREEIAGALAEGAMLAGDGLLTEGAERSVQSLEALRDRHACHDHSDDVMAICMAIGPLRP